jgi:hypothetical protein
MTYSIVLLHDSARLHTSIAAHTRALLEHFNWELFDYPPYSPDLAPSDYHLFTYLKNFLGFRCFNNNENFMECVAVLIDGTDCFHTGVQKLIPRYKCPSFVCDYVEK